MRFELVAVHPTKKSYSLGEVRMEPFDLSKTIKKIASILGDDWQVVCIGITTQKCKKR